MLVVILLLVAGSLLVYISKFNFMPVTVNLGAFILTDIPLFYVMIGSLLTGLVLSYAVYLANTITNSLIMREKDKEIKRNRNVELELTKRVHQLELENEKLKNNSSDGPEDPNAL